jgi:hypothetical protein
MRALKPAMTPRHCNPHALDQECWLRCKLAELAQEKNALILERAVWIVRVPPVVRSDVVDWEVWMEASWILLFKT